MRRIRLTIAYDGTNYVGWQVQPNGVSIEEVLNGALKKLLKEEISVIGASRTDSGVHADGNVCVFDTESRIPADKFRFALNEFLPEDIRVQESKEVPLSYHPRKVNSVKTYEYRILNRVLPLPKERNYSYFYYYPLDEKKMDRAAKALLGEHDFKSFCSIRTNAEDTVRRIYTADVTREGDIITLRLSGSGFLYNMVRIIAGTLVKIGAGIYPEEAMAEILEARSREKAGPRAPAMGLTLKSIAEEEALPERIREENRHWAYDLYQGNISGAAREEKSGNPCAFMIIRACDGGDYDALLLRLTKYLSRNGALDIYCKDETGRLKDGRAADYFTYRVPEKLPGDIPETGEWFVTRDEQKAGEYII